MSSSISLVLKHSETVTCVAYSLDGNLMARFKVFSPPVTLNTLPQSQRSHPRPSGSAEGIVLLHKSATHDIIQKVGDGKSGHGGAVLDVCFTIKGKAFVTACSDALVRVWQVRTGKDTRNRKPHRAQS
jgi:WD40 repeat protein